MTSAYHLKISFQSLDYNRFGLTGGTSPDVVISFQSLDYNRLVRFNNAICIVVISF
ncbi:hypothetical protein C7460_12235 [Marinoscillum furvescens DSM 4134]|uniref:Uncharacterized protein n=1 Tax=Marinoscillum furvescens DSM 4134 TaxID=1122208 RepID=A0A3D9KXV5_MARFU|nr:hypothetical protein C7460_12235 [Marinoscillum furvescens DSM 4134]